MTEQHERKRIQTPLAAFSILSLRPRRARHELGEATVRVSAALALPSPRLIVRKTTRLANVAGTQEPIYGPSAIHSVAHQAQSVPYTELTRDDLKWAALSYTCVETQTFYITADSGHVAMAQVIYSNVAYVSTAARTTPESPNTSLTDTLSTPPQWRTHNLPIQLQSLLPKLLSTSAVVLRPARPYLLLTVQALLPRRQLRRRSC